MLEACRACLGLIDVDNLPFYEIEADDEQLSTESCRFKLLSIIPEMALNITPKSMICAECHGSLEAMYEFKAKCLKTENIITEYLHAKPDVNIKNLDLKDVSAFNMSYGADVKNIEDEVFFDDVALKREEESSQITEDEAAEAFIEYIAVKEEVESSDEAFVAIHESITVKNEVDDYSSESVEAVQPEKTVLESEKSMCRICSKNFFTKFRLNRHMNSHTNKRPYKCTICSRGFNDKSTLKRHGRRHSQVKHECKVCGKKFSVKKYFDIHMMTHIYTCDHCDKRFINKQFLNRHLYSFENPYCCEICGNQYGQNKSLTVHMRKHTGKRPYICTVCSKSFYSKESLKLHEKCHNKHLHFACTVCGEYCTSNASLKLHTDAHSKEELYECNTCQKKFTTPCSLITHQSEHSGVKGFKCEQCEKTFLQKRYLRIHMKVHTQQQLFSCRLCKKMFNWKSSAKKHVRKIHKDVDANTVVIECSNTSITGDIKTETQEIRPNEVL